MKVAVIGGVASTETLIYALVQHGFEDIRVWGYEPSKTTLVSGWRDLRKLAGMNGLPFQGFSKVMDCEESLRSFAPDVLFAVGLSQIIPPSMLQISSRANVGFHPTALPRGRGRAALAWLILEGQNGAATFFEMTDGVDDGPIYIQENFLVSENDNTADVEVSMLAAERLALDQWLPRLKNGDFSTIQQDHQQASWFGRRAPEDGWINWKDPRDDLLRLIRASAPPHPGAYTFCGAQKIIVLNATISNRSEMGVQGRILAVKPGNGFEVQAGDGIIHVTEWECDNEWTPRVGALLGYYAEAEIHALRIRLETLELTVTNLIATLKK